MIALLVRYDMPGEDGETRRERNARFDQPSPEIDPADRSPEADRMLRLFRRLSSFRTQGFNGPDPLQPGMVRDWCLATGRPLGAAEIEIMFDMDAAYLAACQREGRSTGGA